MNLHLNLTLPDNLQSNHQEVIDITPNSGLAIPSQQTNEIAMIAINELQNEIRTLREELDLLKGEVVKPLSLGDIPKEDGLLMIEETWDVDKYPSRMTSREVADLLQKNLHGFQCTITNVQNEVGFKMEKFPIKGKGRRPTLFRKELIVEILKEWNRPIQDINTKYFVKSYMKKLEEVNLDTNT